MKTSANCNSLTYDEIILGLDLGTNSVGWALVGLNKFKPSCIVDMGSRIFESVVNKSDYEKGQGETKAAERRGKRMARRLTTRRRRRKIRVFRRLQENKLLPEGESTTVLQSLDQELRAKYFAGEKKIPALEHTLPYYLRALALDQQLPLHEIGRAIYHLAQRRGFKSNRKTAKSDKDDGTIKSSIAELRQKITDQGARTLGEFFSKMDPTIERIRQKYTHRDMYETEFDAIISSQKQYYPHIFNETFTKQIKGDIFFQRPLKSAKGSVAFCSLEPKSRRAPIASLEAQKFRILHMVNSTAIISPHSGQSISLKPEQRAVIIAELEKGSLTFANAKKLLGMPRTAKFNWETGGEKKFKGHTVNETMSSIFGDGWFHISKDKQNEAIADLLSYQDDQALFKRAKNYWKLNDESAGKMSVSVLEEGYSAHSRKALQKLLPLMEEGQDYSTARKTVYPESFIAGTGLDILPQARTILTSLRNPVVERTLNEVRKIVNGIIKKYGKPYAITIELSRDLKTNRKQKQESIKRMRELEKQRKAAEQIIKESGISKPSRNDIEKYLLAEECGWSCPYTGMPISMKTLLIEPSFDVEHIIPFSRCMDNSFNNKTLCHHHENRNIKKNKTPFEAYHGTQKWEDILQRIAKFKYRGRYNQKLDRFKMANIENLDDFCSRQLNDTRYSSKLACKYLSVLYGGKSDSEHTMRIFTGNGRITSFLRGIWNLNTVLQGNGEDKRNDHRHHAIDALATALLTPKTIKALSESAARTEGNPSVQWRRLFSAMEEPWSGFLDEARTKINVIITSHRANHKVNGPLHEETIYSRPIKSNTGPALITIRKELSALSKDDINRIIDLRTKEIVINKLAEMNEDNPGKAFKEVCNHPVFATTPQGKTIPIHKVRISVNKNPQQLSSGSKERYILTGSNHHMEVFAVMDSNKNILKWDARAVSMLEARRRLVNKESVVQRNHGPNTKFLFTLTNSDIIELDSENSAHGKEFYKIRGITERADGAKVFDFCRINDARLKKAMQESDTEIGAKGGNRSIQFATPHSLSKRHCRKVTITPLGEVRRSNE
ncbi:MAG: type II CRISPR RNA-guided endonuclease Cas9 [Candidatus Wallbacteria bacterium HGW-Wallbacteria-1]|uniref:CRISPR-associated endonuclease Cas9 n=1 Tax=Candidatus Wallbacteria bacterium HGW-Wallbacteria-1 TaxID=2013854 RepID=A0A2N1PNI8_9BACT|nr:MAG: type II CRISPR RNA-guided endonuclease Cas9 [Candidatus Wallbacteria bacterium HGW-Wallbacteria-1]